MWIMVGYAIIQYEKYIYYDFYIYTQYIRSERER